jgi:O-acetyl-ADP-ribose deacetylase (regulator of RNase III)
MIIIKQGNIFQSECQTITSPVNCLGICGKGLALAFKQNFPNYYIEYKNLCTNNKILPGHPVLHKNFTPYILSFPTKDHWRDPSKLEWIETGLSIIKNKYEQLGIISLALPALGVGLGGLDWTEVKEMTYSILDDLPLEVELYEPR